MKLLPFAVFLAYVCVINVELGAQSTFNLLEPTIWQSQSPGDTFPHEGNVQTEIGHVNPSPLNDHPDRDDGLARDPQICTARDWFATANALVMNRVREDDIFLGYDDANPTTRLLLRDAGMEYSGGFEAHFGRRFGACWAVEAVYWGIYSDDRFAHLYASDVIGNVVSPVQFDFLEYDNGTGTAPADNYFDNTQVLRIVRSFQHHNVELNLWRHTWAQTLRSNFRFLAGVRYLQLKEIFDFDTDVANDAFGDDLANELFYDINLENHLVGFQVGGQLDYCLTERLALQVASKVGICGNRVKHRQSLWGGNGNARIAATSPLGYVGSAYSSNASKEDVAFLAELDFGLSFDLIPCWQAVIGYRAVGLSGVAVPTGQIPLRFDDLGAVDRIHSNDSVILHGAYAGIEYNW